MRVEGGGAAMSGRTRVAYFHDDTIGNFCYGQAHPMKPHRVAMTHNLVVNYKMDEQMDVFVPYRALDVEMAAFHTKEYISFLKDVNPRNKDNYRNEQILFSVGEDCPIFEGLYEFCQIYCGGSIQGARRLNTGQCDIAINWAGGLHHAHKAEAAGFCYVNDIVLAILELLKHHARVLYIDIDIHHGDGVEEAFLLSNRVMTVSFHKYGPKGGDMFFPGTGDVTDVGQQEGTGYAVNFPLKDGVTDEQYSERIFKPIIGAVVETFKPSAIVLQCGADSLAGDRLGCFNMTSMCHGSCVEFVKGFHLPLLVLGGGGYTISSVARCWTYETACLLGADISLGHIPENEYSDYFAPDHALFVGATSGMENQNTHSQVERHKNKILEHLRAIQGAPSTQLKEMPTDFFIDEEESLAKGERGKGSSSGASSSRRETGAGVGPGRHRHDV